MLIKLVIILSVCIILCQTIAINHYELIAVCRRLGIRHPIFINVPNRITLTKSFFDSNRYVTFGNGVVTYSFIFYAETLEDLLNLSNQNVMKKFDSGLIIVKDNIFENSTQLINLTIENQIFLMNEDSKLIYETYTINGIKIVKPIAQNIENHFKWFQDPNLIIRRSNFHGIHLKALTEIVEGPNSYLDENYETLATFHPSNETYLVNKYHQGIYKSVLQILESELNFTTSIFKRKDGAWGFVDKSSNGTIVASGMIGDVVNSKVNMLVVSLVLTSKRVQYMDFITPLTQDFGSIFLPGNSIVEEIDFGKTFAAPFRLEMWIAVGISLLIIVFTKLFIMHHYLKLNISSSLAEFWNSIMSHLGELQLLSNTKQVECRRYYVSHSRML